MEFKRLIHAQRSVILPEKKKFKIRNKLHFEVRVVPLNAYPDLIENPANPYVKMRDEERLTDFIQACGYVWAQTLRDRIVTEKTRSKK